MSEKTKQHIAAALGIILLFLIVYWSGAKLIDRLSGTRLLEILSGLFGRQLQIDEKGHTNVLLLGVGGGQHEGSNLTDAIIIASINRGSNHIAMLSIPRDLYVESQAGSSRINELYENAVRKWGPDYGLSIFKQTIEKILAVPIHYAAKVDFLAFSKVVDSFGGIDVYVDETINDPFYPKEDTFDYERFYLPAGLQHLDGETALKYVRSRKTSSDFDRSKRQQKALLALKNKAADKSGYSRKNLLKQLYYSLKDHVETDMSIPEMISLADYIAHWDSSNLSLAALNDDPSAYGGFLYTPLREAFGGAFVLLPAGNNFDAIDLFTNFIFDGPYNITSYSVAILNGTKSSGLAATTKIALKRYGVTINRFGNAVSQKIEATTWYAASQDAQNTVEFLQKLIPGKISYQIPKQYASRFPDSRLILEIGGDSIPKINALDIFRGMVIYGAGSSTADGTSTSAGSTSPPLKTEQPAPAPGSSSNDSSQ